MKKNKEWIELSDEDLEKLSKMKTCDICINCIYVEQGDMYCDISTDYNKDTTAWVYDNYNPTDEYMWCNGKHFEER